MGISRYTFSRQIKKGKLLNSNSNMSRINALVNSGDINCNTYVLEEGQRLDHISAVSYGDASYWWVIAAASGIGWCLQVPPGTFLKIPRDLNDIIGLLG